MYDIKKVVNKILEGADVRKVLSETNFDSLEDNKITAILQFLDVTNTPENREKIELSGYNDNVYLVLDAGAVMVCNDSEADAEFKDAFMSIVDDLGLDYFSDSDQKYITDNFIKNDIIDWDAVCKWVKKNDGRGVPLSWADGCEYKENVNGETYYLYPRDEVDNLKDAFSEVD